ncbi:hypothetical protein ACIQXF_13020 [Lysinibacillus sp. NPDC097231]|uniref:hypothetical protein n=1 Tax=Lysinibacillus sp. NPDC097231 TaxID=3364142 RepID=UPI00381071CD
MVKINEMIDVFKMNQEIVGRKLKYIQYVFALKAKKRFYPAERAVIYLYQSFRYKTPTSRIK